MHDAHSSNQDILSGRHEVAGQDFFSALDCETHFYLVRHGQSMGNARRIFQGRMDLSLDDTGRAQAAALGVWFSRTGIDAVFSSPLVRASETAGILASACGLSGAQVDPVFVELDTGAYTGISYEQAREQYPDSFRNFDGESWNAVPGAENSETLFARAMSAWAVLENEARSGKNSIVCVSHGGFLQWLVKTTFGLRSWKPLLPTDNCAIFELVIAPTSIVNKPFMQWKRFNYQIPGGVSVVEPVF